MELSHHIGSGPPQGGKMLGRGGRAIKKEQTGLEGVKAGRVGRRKPKQKGHRENLPRLTRPLSELASDYPSVPLTDASTFAYRSVNERQREVEVDGKIKRPLNAFMLYRKVYQEVAKLQCSKNNHQHVSTVCGTSWRELEPLNIRRKFEHLAHVEKEKHGEAHPGYKYIPVSCRKTKRSVSVESLSEIDSDDDEGRKYKRSGTPQRKRTPRTNRQRSTRSPSVAFAPDHGPPNGIWSSPGQPHETPYSQGKGYGAHVTPYASPALSHLEPHFATPPQSFTYPDPSSVGSHHRQMTSNNDPYFPAYGLAPPSWNNSHPSPAANGYAEAQPVWQPQQYMSPVPQWSLLGTEHDAYLGDQSDWLVENIEPSQLSEFYSSVEGPAVL